VEAIQADQRVLEELVGHLHRAAGVRRLVLLHAPGGLEVILGAGAADRREIGVTIDVELHLALAPPVRPEGPDADHAADEATRPFDVIKDHVITLHHRGVLAAELGMEPGGVRGEPVAQFIVDLVEERPHLLSAGHVVGDRELRMCPEGHGEVAVEPPAQDLRHIGGGQYAAPAVSHAEEVAQRHLDAGHRTIIPVHPQDHVPHRLGRAVGNGDPDVPDDPAAVDIHQGGGFAVLDLRDAGRALAALAEFAGAHSAGADDPRPVLPGDCAADDAIGDDRQFRVEVGWAEGRGQTRSLAARQQHQKHPRATADERAPPRHGISFQRQGRTHKTLSRAAGRSRGLWHAPSPPATARASQTLGSATRP